MGNVRENSYNLGVAGVGLQSVSVYERMQSCALHNTHRVFYHAEEEIVCANIVIFKKQKK